MKLAQRMEMLYRQKMGRYGHGRAFILQDQVQLLAEAQDLENEQLRKEIAELRSALFRLQNKGVTA